MKNTSIHFLVTVIVATSFIPIGSAGTERPFTSNIVCYETKVIARWTFILPKPSQNHQAMVSIELTPGRNAKGEITQSVFVKAIEGLYWDKNFENVYYRPTSKPHKAPILCARRYWYGIEKNEPDCDLKWEMKPSSQESPTICGNEKVFLFTSSILVNN